MDNLRPAVHRTIWLVDVEAFGDQQRTNVNQVAVRDGVYRALEEACRRAEIPWSTCRYEDRGDGVFVLAPADIPKSAFVDRVPQALVEALRDHNSTHPQEEWIRLRMAVHAGEIYLDDHGATGNSINHAFRLLEARPLKSALAQSSGVLAVIASSYFYDEVVRHSPAMNGQLYRQVEVSEKETDTIGWIYLPDQPEPEHSLDTVTERIPRNNHDSFGPSAEASMTEIFFSVVEALESVPCMRAENTRLMLIDQLSPAISGNIKHFSQRRMHVVSILQSCLDYQEGLHELLTAICLLEQAGSVHVQRLVDALRASEDVTFNQRATISRGPGSDAP